MKRLSLLPTRAARATWKRILATKVACAMVLAAFVPFLALAGPRPVAIPAEARAFHAAQMGTWAQRMGLTFASSLTVREVRRFSYAEVIAPDCGGLRPGDRIRSVNGQDVENPQQFERVVKRIATRQPQPWTFLVERGGKTFLAEPSSEFRDRCHPLTLLNCGRALIRDTNSRARGTCGL